MELDARFACPACAETIQVKAEYDDEGSSWNVTIEHVEE